MKKKIVWRSTSCLMAMKRAMPLYLAVALIGLFMAAAPAIAKGKYDPGATDTSIKIGCIMPLSGPASAYGIIGRCNKAYFDMVNAMGGINGRKIEYLLVDDGYSPPKTVEQARRLVEKEKVLLIHNPLGTPTNSAIMKYMNVKKVPQLFISSGAGKWGSNPKEFPYTMGWQPTYPIEGRIVGRYILKSIPNPKVAVLYQNDDYGKDYLNGLKEGLGDQADKLIVSALSYETSDPTIDSQIVSLKNSGANVFFNITTPKFAAQAIRKVYDIGWRPTHFLNSVSNSIGAVLEPAGIEKSIGIISVQYLKDPNDAQWKDDADCKTWGAFMDKYFPEGNKADNFNVFSYANSYTMHQVLKMCGDNLTRENVMKQAASLKDMKVPMLLPGIMLNTSPNDFYPIEQEQLSRFDGKKWVLFGEVIGTE